MKKIKFTCFIITFLFSFSANRLVGQLTIELPCSEYVVFKYDSLPKFASENTLITFYFASNFRDTVKLITGGKIILDTILITEPSTGLAYAFDYQTSLLVDNKLNLVYQDVNLCFEIDNRYGFLVISYGYGLWYIKHKFVAPEFE